uniref:Class I histocompatibility antigen, F10 alpha chain-like n=1 Tax=Taeniopygia guttata TaxID=59729 RepID=A0A674GLT3_TAEGU
MTPSTPPNLRVPPVHSLHYLTVAVSEPSPGVPQYTIIGFVDGIPFVRYDSERGRMEPLTQWMKDGAEPGYWDGQTQSAVRHQHLDARNLEILQERYNQSRGLHTALWASGCDLLSDGSVRGSFQYGYDGRDFISFDLGSGKFLAADSAAEITRRRWEQEEEAERWTYYLKHECPEWLRKYAGFGQKELERKGGSRIPAGIWEWRTWEHGNSCGNSKGRSHPHPISVGIPWSDLTPIPSQWEFHGQISPPSHLSGNSMGTALPSPILMGVPWAELTPMPFPWNSMHEFYHYPIPEPPDVHVSGKEEYGTLILSCHAYGFYPNTITVSWMKENATLDQEMEWGGIVPNSDGTFHTWARIKALPEEREQYRCKVDHPGMLEPGLFAWGETGNVGIGNLEFPNGDSPPHYPTCPRADVWQESHHGGCCVCHRCHPHPHCPHRIRCLEAPIR